jgi:hypothetical protein
MTDKRCGTCRFFVPVINEATGRVRHGEPGRCAYKVAWPVLPDCYYSSALCGFRLPIPVLVYSKTGRDCLTWEEKEKKR